MKPSIFQYEEFLNPIQKLEFIGQKLGDLQAMLDDVTHELIKDEIRNG